MTPSDIAEALGVPVNRVRVWIHRHHPTRQACGTCDVVVEPLGRIGRWQRYDYRALARVERAHRHPQEGAA